MSLEVDAGDVIRLISQFLKENNLSNTLRALQEESQITMNTVDNVDKFVLDIQQGRWDVVLETTSTLRLPADKLADLFEQVILELAEMNERDSARAILRQTPVMQQLKKENPERYVRLEHILQRTFFDYNEAYPNGGNKERRRNQIANDLKSEVVTAPPSRLLSLIGQALKWQQFQGMLPKGAKYDLFRGAAPVAAIEDEKRPEKNVKVIKFGKKSHAEVAKFSPDGQYLVSGSSDGFIEVWDYDTGKLAKELKYQAEDEFMMHEHPVISLSFSRDSELIATGDTSGGCKVWRLKTGTALRKFPSAHEKGVTSVEFARDGTQILTASFDHTVRIHGLKSGRTLKEFRGHKSFVHTAIFNEDGGQVISGSADGTIKVWDAKTTDCLKTFTPNPATSSSLTVTGLQLLPKIPDRMYVATRSKDLRILSIGGQVVQTYTVTGSGDVAAWCPSPKGAFVYAIGEDSIMYSFAADSGKLEHMIKVHEKGATGVTHHPHRNVLATYSPDGTMKIWRP